MSKAHSFRVHPRHSKAWKEFFDFNYIWTTLRPRKQWKWHPDESEERPRSAQQENCNFVCLHCSVRLSGGLVNFPIVRAAEKQFNRNEVIKIGMEFRNMSGMIRFEATIAFLINSHSYRRARICHLGWGRRNSLKINLNNYPQLTSALLTFLCKLLVASSTVVPIDWTVTINISFWRWNFYFKVD